MQILKGDFAAHLSLHDKVLLVAFVLLKVLLVVALPLTGDEAYFIGWGQNLASGYYDHPPAVGWVLFGLSTLADNLYWYRSFALFTSVVVAYVLYKLVRLNHSVSPVVAFYVGLVFFVSPVSLMFVLTANDTVLVLFGLVGGYFFARTVLPDSLNSPQSSDVLNSFKTLTLWPILAGLFLGMAFLSKYFAAFVLLGLLLWTFSHYKTVPWRRVTLMVLIVLGFVVQNLYFNATQCWNNILFNFFSRTAQSAFSWTDLVSNVALYGLMLVFMLSPLGVVYWVKTFKNSRHKKSPQNSLLESSSLNLPGLVNRPKPFLMRFQPWHCTPVCRCCWCCWW
ncbi:ArnT family glycosyltransferase [Thiomicrorhabdus aquaedulcis]|uniref:ArnT family glycosyltransferase n=1 Tax=Thiomicrorhabdus aquaedulcis TaxID=2211106 RepID=UPI000FDC81D0|nr:phospholipid carrier-dependent glycosyltransferase [Thiomicrorhabdus aquaedulcis]